MSDEQQTPDQDPVDQALSQMHEALGDPEEPEWAVVIIDLPTGQASWHVSPDDMDLFGHVDQSEINTWDGHTTEQKYARLRALTEGGSDA